MSANLPRFSLDDPGDSLVGEIVCIACTAPNSMAGGQASEAMNFPTLSINAELFISIQQQDTFISLPISPFGKNVESPHDTEKELTISLHLSDQQWQTIDEWLFRGMRLGAIRAIMEAAKVGLRESRRAAYERYTILKRTRPDEFLSNHE